MRNDVLTVYVDADSCPVKEEIGHLCKKYNKKLIFVASYAHEINPSLGAKLVTVDSRAEEADLYIVNHCHRGDVVVTQDHGLAGLLLPKGVNVISLRGKIFLEEDMNELLFY